MILADTSVWVDHLASATGSLDELLDRGKVCMHSLVIGEIACGSLHHRRRLLSQLRSLPALPVVADEAVVAFIEHHRLMSRGIGFIDLHLLAAAVAAPGTRLWSRDRRLAEAAAELDLAFPAHDA